jgi:hypothetical protein
MRRALVAAIALFSTTMLAYQTSAMTLAAPAALGSAAAGTSAVMHTAVVCGGNGCGPVQTSAPRRPLKTMARGH